MNNDLTQALQAKVKEALERKQPLAIVGGGSKIFCNRQNRMLNSISQATEAYWITNLASCLSLHAPVRH